MINNREAEELRGRSSSITQWFRLKAGELSQGQVEVKHQLKAEVLPLSEMIGFLQSSGTSPVHNDISVTTASDLSAVSYFMSHEGGARYESKKCTMESGLVDKHSTYHQ